MVWGSLIAVLSVGVLGLAALALLALPKDAEIGVHVGTRGFDIAESRNFAVGMYVGLAALAVALAVIGDAVGAAVLLLAVTFTVNLIAVVRAMVDDVG